MRLGVNIDHIAALRQARRGFEPEPVLAALIAEASGADAIVAHLREDRRHIQDSDLYILKKLVKTKLNLEMSVSDEIVGIACDCVPNQATLVPEKRQELTTEAGLDVVSNFSRVKRASEKLTKSNIAVSLFIDPDKRQIDVSKRLGAGSIELHTGLYANARNKKEQDKYFKQLQAAVNYAAKKKLRIFAGHGLDYYNVSRIAGIKKIEELNIGYSIIGRACFIGLAQAVKEMKALLQ